MWYASWKLWHQSLCSKNIWVPQWYPYYYETLLIQQYFSIDNISMERTNVTSQLNVVPQWYPKNIFRKIYTLSFLSSNTVSIICIVILDQKLHPIQCLWFFDILSFTKISPFHWKLWRNLQSSQGCKSSPRLHNGTCNTAFESLDVIVFDMIIFGYYSGTQNTQNITYVRHLK